MALTITGVIPVTGSTLGGDTITVSGTDLNTVTTVTVGGTAAPDFEALSAKFLQILTPAGAAGAVNIVIGDGSTTVTLTGQFTYAVPADADTEDLIATLARDWALDVDMADVGDPPEWKRLRGMTNLVPKVDPTLQDDSDYDSDGWASSVKTMQAWTLELTLARKKGRITGDYPLTQERIRLASTRFGGEGTIHVRWYKRLTGDPEAYEGVAQIGWNPAGGGPADLDSASVTLTGVGKRHDIVNPAA
jgi:hypothetical protein